MSRTLVMGSCRVAEPLKELADVVLYPGGHVHSSGEFLQAVKVMRGLEAPGHLDDYLFRGWGNQPDRHSVLGEGISEVVVELCSLKQYRWKRWLIHMGYEERVVSGDLEPLKGDVTLFRESPQEVEQNLDLLAEAFPACRFVVFLQNNVPQIPERYLLGEIASRWCRRTGNRLIDASSIVAKYGIDRCFPRLECGGHDLLHYTDDMKGFVREAFLAEDRPIVTIPSGAPGSAWNEAPEATTTPIRPKAPQPPKGRWWRRA